MDEPRAARLDAGPGRAGRRTTPSGRGAGSPSRPGRRRDAQRAGRWDCSPASSRSQHRSVESTGARRRRLVRRTAARATGPADQRAEDERSLTLHLGAARRAARDPRLPGGRRSRSRSTARARSSPCACATSRPTARRCSSRAACSTSPTATATTTREPLEPGQPLRRHVRLDAIAQRVPAGPPPARRGLDRVLAVGLARRPSRSRSRCTRGRLTLPARPPRDEPSCAASGRPSGRRRWRSRRSSPGATTPHATATTRPPARTSCASSGTSAAIAASSTAAPRCTTRTSRPTASSTATRCRRACACSCSSALGRGAWRTRVDTDSADDRDGDRVPRHPAPRRLRGRRAGLLALVGAGVPARRV